MLKSVPNAAYTCIWWLGYLHCIK